MRSRLSVVRAICRSLLHVIFLSIAQVHPKIKRLF